VIRQLGGLLEGSKKLFKSELFDTTKEIIEHFQTSQNEVQSMILDINKSGKASRLKWVFTHKHVKGMLLKMYQLKQLVHLAVSTLQVAIEQEKLNK
jgi:hypothetical protein